MSGNVIKVASMSRKDSFRAFWWFLVLALVVVILAPQHFALALVGYPIAVIAAIVAGFSIWEYYELCIGERVPPVVTGSVIHCAVWVVLAAIEAVTLAVVWQIGGFA